MSTKPETGFGIDVESTFDTLAKPLELLESFIMRMKKLVEQLIHNTSQK